MYKDQGAFLIAHLVKESTYNAGDLGSILGLGRFPGEGKGLDTTERLSLSLHIRTETGKKIK